ncbi:tumor necrosis factor ligand superfamily member 8 [Pogona vitticeps]
MNCRSPEKSSFIQMISPQEESKDMTKGSVPRQSNAPIHTYLCFIVASLTLCLLVALGTIVILALQRTGSVAPCDGPQRAPMDGEATRSTQTMMLNKAMAYLQVLKPINQSQLRWNKDGLLYNIRYDEGNLVIQSPGTYFIYCHLQYFVPKCESSVIDLSLRLLVNNVPMKETVLTLCSSRETIVGVNHDIFAVLMMELNEGSRVSVEISPFTYLDADNIPSSNVLGAFKYMGEDWKCPFLGTIAGKCP